MSRWLGTKDELTLADAGMALRGAAHAAGTPGWIWLAGLFFPSLTMLLGLSFSEALQIENQPLDLAVGGSYALALLLSPLMLFPLRLQAGLALLMQPRHLRELGRSGDPAAPKRYTPRLRSCWNASRGLLGTCLALWLRVVLTLLVGLALVIVPPWFFLKGTGLDPHSYKFYGLLTPFFALGALYQLSIAMLFQLALQSLVRHRRGAASALLHAWRIASHRPWATFRAALVDLMLTLGVLVLTYAVTIALVVSIVGILAIPLALVALAGMEGVTRAGYWARMYIALGGLPETSLPEQGSQVT
jgi:hypothetical protein